MGLPVNTISTSTPNLLINGAFDFWQRNTSFSQVNGAYNADRWAHFFDGSGSAATISQQAFPVGQTLVPGNPNYFHRLAVTTAGSGGLVRYLNQPIENVALTSGKTLTVSFWAKADAARILALNFAQLFGSGGSSFVQIVPFASSPTVSVTTSWARYNYTFTIPSVTGKTIGSGSYLGLQLFYPINTICTVDISNVMVTEGSFAPPLFYRAGGSLIGSELQLCQRYYEIGGEFARSNVSPLWGNNYPEAVAYGFKVTKRATPTLVTNAASSHAINQFVDTNGFNLSPPQNGTGNWYIYLFGSTADAEL